jgi:hypothetical protein
MASRRGAPARRLVREFARAELGQLDEESRVHECLLFLLLC